MPDVNFRPPSSRRDVLRHAALIPGAGFLLAGTTNHADAAKIPQDAAGYQASPKDGQRCGDCTHFAPPSSCKVVDGTISDQGWCKMFSKKE